MTEISSPLLADLTATEQADIRALPVNRLPPGSPADWTISDLGFAWANSQRIPHIALNETFVQESSYHAHWQDCQAHEWLPLHVGPDVACVVSHRAFSPQTRRSVAKLLRTEIYWSVCTEEDFSRTLSALGEPPTVRALPPPATVPSRWRLQRNLAEPDPDKACVLEVLHHAHHLGASDVFIEDLGTRLDIRFRLSGIAEVFPPVPQRARASFISALKRMAAVNANARYDFHDARFEIEPEPGHKVDVRASFSPTLDGESITLRLQDGRKIMVASGTLPLPKKLEKEFRSVLAKKGGLVLVTGPTGSGKTTTLYSALLTMDRSDLVIRTIEDPVEYTLDGVSQLPVGGDTGRTFGQALRSILRRNPDVILIGEIRDDETAQLALDASLSGHTVLATLHAPDCTETITRYLSINPKPDTRVSLAASLALVLSQRLAPRLCQDCKESVPLKDEEAQAFAAYGLHAPEHLWRRRGCPSCGNGVRGRVPLFEQVVITATLRDIIAGNSSFSSKDFRETWMKSGGEPMGAYALNMAAAGEISFDEAKKHMVWAPDRS